MNAGGRKARAALSRLIKLTAEPNAKTVMSVAGVEGAAAQLMKRGSTSDEIQGLAGSVLTILTGMPVVSAIAEETSGSSGEVHIVLPRPSRIYQPDETALELN